MSDSAHLLAAWREQVNRRLEAETNNGEWAAVHVVDLAPGAFLALTGWDDGWYARPFDAEAIADWPELPHLELFDDGAAFGHAGRHRVAAARMAGLSRIPIVVWLFARGLVKDARMQELRRWVGTPQALPPQPWTVSSTHGGMGWHIRHGIRMSKQVLC